METVNSVATLGYTFGSYRTYEEWKLQAWAKAQSLSRQFLPYLWGMETSLRIHIHTIAKRSFLPYLWGMETRKIQYQIFLERWFLPYLWGMETVDCTGERCTSNRVLTVPMRNGNSHALPDCTFPSIGSYRTYEEWKPERTNNTWRALWIRSYRTYEEWKRFHDGIFWFDVPVVLTVPMRNGNIIRH